MEQEDPEVPRIQAKEMRIPQYTKSVEIKEEFNSKARHQRDRRASGQSEGGNTLREREEGWGKVQLPPMVEGVGERGI